MAINVSGRQFKQNNFLSSITAILKKTGVEPQFLNFEVTESILIEDVDKIVNLLMNFRQLGIKISIDDFGTGYSSLSYLKSFPVNILKIDRSFITDLVNDESNAAIAQAVIAIARILKMTVIAEGVENEQQLAILRQLQCDEIQGYYFSPPVTFEKATQFLNQQEQGQTLTGKNWV
jgi:EAL domain-containing protein (putative c-di-GMP-specific phosphodiesterase class I)